MDPLDQAPDHVRPATEAERADVRAMHRANRAAWDEAAERYEGWRDWTSALPAPLRWKLALGGQTREGLVYATIKGARIEDGETVSQIVGTPGRAGETFDAEVNGANARIVYAWSEGALWVSCGGDHAFADLRLAPPVRDVTAQAGAIVARMNGKIAAILVKPGARVKAGDALVTLEAMKMEHVMAAPVAARVRAIDVTVGEQVAPGRVLVELGESTATGSQMATKRLAKQIVNMMEANWELPPK